jgi:hypothetical protein
MHLFGLTGLAYMWALMAKAAQAKIAAGSSDPFYVTKLRPAATSSSASCPTPGPT